MSARDRALLEAAERYVGLGWRLLLVRPGAKIPLPGSHGVHDATSDLGRLRALLARFPGANLALACGPESGVLALDVDRDQGKGLDGFEALAYLEADLGPLPDTVAARTPRGGEHRLFRFPPGASVKGTPSVGGHRGIDVRSRGNYLLLSPSQLRRMNGHPGGHYAWIAPPWERELAELPPPWVAFLSSPRRTPAEAPGEAPQRPAEALERTRAERWAAAALERETEAVARAVKHTRNNTLNEAAFYLGQIIGAGLLPEDLVVSRLLEASRVNGYIQEHSERAALATIRSGIDSGKKKPRGPADRPERARTTVAVPAPVDAEGAGRAEVGREDVDEALRSFELTDRGNARRFALLFADRLRYCQELQAWFIWNGRYWERDPGVEVEALAKELTDHLLRAATTMAPGDARNHLVRWAMTSQRAGRIRALLELARSEPELVIRRAQLDSDPKLFCCRNGVIDLVSGELREHRREDLITRCSPVEYEPAARSSLFDRFLDFALGGDAEMVVFLAWAAGTCLAGIPPADRFFFIYGPTASAKTTFIEGLKTILGSYGTTARFETFLQGAPVSGAAPTPDLARLAGVRAVFATELEDGRRLAAGAVKQITGADTIQARELYGRPFTFRPVLSLWLVGNDAPKIRHEDEALWRRVLRVPFDHQIPEGERDPAVKAAFQDPRSDAARALLAWSVEGCRRWLQDRTHPPVPARVAESTTAYRDEMDPLRPWLEDACRIEPGNERLWTSTAALRESYENWCRRTGVDAIRSGRAFAQLLRGHGLREHRRPGARGWAGVELLPPGEGRMTP